MKISVVIRYKWTAALFAGLIALYLAQILLVPPDPEALHRYGISAAKAHVLGLTIAIPYILVWFTAIIGYFRVRGYSAYIQEGKDGKAFKIIAIGLLWLAAWLPIQSIMSGFAADFSRTHEDATAHMIQLANYLPLVIYAVATWYIYVGSELLVSLVKTKDLRGATRIYLIVSCLFIVFSAMYVYMVFHDPARQHPVAGVERASYYQPDWVILFTLVVPRLLVWYIGIRAALNMYMYRQKVRGSLYRAALKSFALGIVYVLLFNMLLRSLQTLSVPLSKLSLGVMLLLLYLLLILVGVSYSMVARGAKRLRQLEVI